MAIISWKWKRSPNANVRPWQASRNIKSVTKNDNTFAIRHGQTDWNLDGRYQGQSDIPLNQDGRARAKVLANQIQLQNFAAIFTKASAGDCGKFMEIYPACGLEARLDFPHGSKPVKRQNPGHK
jgi:hypothetical protein